MRDKKFMERLMKELIKLDVVHSFNSRSTNSRTEAQRHTKWIVYTPNLLQSISIK